MAVNTIDPDLLRRMASKYIYWKAPDEAVAMPQRVIAKVMDIGEYDDVQVLAGQVGDEVLREVLTQSEIGQFDVRSWCYWHYRLGLAELDRVPALPGRRIE